MTAAIYCRINHDPQGEAAGVTRQEADCRSLAALRDLDVSTVLVDNDVSAYSGVNRPAYQELLTLLRNDSIDAVIAWHPDRLHRSPQELEEFIAILDVHGVDVHTVTAGLVDLSTPIGRMIARQLGTFARYESEHRSERIKAANRQRAEQGRPHRPRVYGYDSARDSAGRATEDGRRELVPKEADLIREATRRVLEGQPLSRICADFNSRGIPSPRNKSWLPESLSKILLS